MNFSIRPNDLATTGVALQRPESVRVGPDGRIFCSDARGGVMSIAADGAQNLIGGPRQKFVPNGITVLANGGFLVANIGEDGGLWYLDGDASHRQLEILVGGKPLPAVNFAEIDTAGRLWISVSSAGEPDPVFTRSRNDGFIVLGDDQGFRVVATGFSWTNELRVSPSGDRLFVNETFGRKLVQFRIAHDGTLSDRTVLAEFGPGDYPDGMALDADGGIWVVSIISNRIYRVKDGECRLVFEDAQPEVVDRLENLLNNSGWKRADLHGLRTGSRVNNISSLVFGGDDMQTAYIGSLNDTCLWTFRSPVTGLRQPSPQFPTFLRSLLDGRETNQL